jgi:hypothetical protein
MLNLLAKIEPPNKSLIGSKIDLIRILAMSVVFVLATGLATSIIIIGEHQINPSILLLASTVLVAAMLMAVSAISILQHRRILYRTILNKRNVGVRATTPRKDKPLILIIRALATAYAPPLVVKEDSSLEWARYMRPGLLRNSSMTKVAQQIVLSREGKSVLRSG